MNLITTEKKGHVFWIGLNRPDERNRMNIEMIKQFSDAYTMMEDDPQIRCGIVYANGKNFTLGLEFDTVVEYLRKEGGWPFARSNVNPWDNGFMGRAKTKPVIIAVHGFCVAMGIELILASEICIAAKSTRFTQSEVRVGLFPIGGGTARLVQRAGYGNAMKYMLTGDIFNAEEAVNMGIVQAVVEKDKLLETANEYAEKISAGAPLGIRAVLNSVRVYEEHGMKACKDQLMNQLMNIIESEDVNEGILAVKNGQKPVFKGN